MTKRGSVSSGRWVVTLALACGCASGVDPLVHRADDLDRHASEMSAAVERAVRDASAAGRAADAAADAARSAAAYALESAEASRRATNGQAPVPDHDAARGSEARSTARLAGARLRLGGSRAPSGPLSLSRLTVVNDRRRADPIFEHYGVNPTIDTAAEPTSTFAADVDTASYALVRSYLEHGELPPEEAVRVEELVNAFDYGYPADPGATFTIHAEIAPSPTRPGFHVLALGLRARSSAGAPRTPANLVVVLDATRSADRPDALTLMRHSAPLLVERQAPGDTLAVVVHGDRPRELAVPRTPSERARLVADIDALVPGAAADLRDGLALGYALAERGFRPGATNRVVLCEAGLAAQDVTRDADAILAEVHDHAARGITTSTIGFGAGGFDDTFLERLAGVGGGHHSSVHDQDEARRVVERDLTGWLDVAAQDVEVSVDLDPAAVSRYRLIGYENRQLDTANRAVDPTDAGELGAGQAVTALYELKLAESPPSAGRLGTIRVRFRTAPSDPAREVEAPLTAAQLRPSFEDASARLRLGATVAAFAEKLRRSYWARAVRYDDLVARLDAVAADLGASAELAELRRAMVLARGFDRRDDRFDAELPASTMGFDEVPVLR